MSISGFGFRAVQDDLDLIDTQNSADLFGGGLNGRLDIASLVDFLADFEDQVRG